MCSVALVAEFELFGSGSSGSCSLASSEDYPGTDLRVQYPGTSAYIGDGVDT